MKKPQATTTETIHDTIWRIKLTDQLTVAELPKDARFASCVPGADSKGLGCLNSYWIVNPGNPPQTRYLALQRTGEPIPTGAVFLTTLATGLHLFEIPAAFANL